MPISRGAQAEHMRPHFQTVQSTRALALTVFTSFEEAESQWRSFETSAVGTAFQSFEWLSAWYRNMGRAENVQPLIVLVSTAGEPLMLAPLGIESSFGVRTLVWLGGRFADYKAPLIAPDFDWRLAKDSFPALWAQIRAALPTHDRVQLESQPAQLGELANPFISLDSTPAPEAAHAFALPKSYNDLLARQSSQTRRSDRQIQYQFKVMGQIEFLVAETPAEVRTMVSDVLDLKAAQLRAQGAGSTFAGMDHRAVYLDLATLEGEGRLLEVAGLYLNGEMIAGGITHVWKGRTTLLMQACNHRFAKFLPDRLMLLHFIHFSILEGRDFFDFAVAQVAGMDSFVDEPMPLYSHVDTTKDKSAPAANDTGSKLNFSRMLKNNLRLVNFLQRARTDAAGQA